VPGDSPASTVCLRPRARTCTCIPNSVPTCGRGRSVTVTAIEYPAALALTRWKGRPRAIGQALARARLQLLRPASGSWSSSAGLRWLSGFFAAS
jgi:hypothetical protein